MYLGLVLTTLFSMVIPAADLASPAGQTYQVGEVVRVVWPSHFECRISNYAPSQTVRFRVYWSDMTVDASDGVSREFLTKLLTDADSIKLYDVQMKSYFRMRAKVCVDGRPLREICLARNMIQPEVPKKTEIAQKHPSRPARQVPFGNVESPRLQPRQVKSLARKIVSVEDLLDTVVDCSILTEETTFSEALDFLSLSVDPPLPLVIFWGDLRANGMIDKDTPIGIEGFGQIKVGLALKILLHSISTTGPEIGVVAEDGLLTLATTQTFQKKRRTKVYPIEDLVSVPSVLNSFFGAGSTRRQGR